MKIFFYILKDNLVDCVVKINQPKIIDKEKLKNLLLVKHIHQHEKDYYKRKTSGDTGNNKRGSCNLDMLQMQGKFLYFFRVKIMPR